MLAHEVCHAKAHLSEVCYSQESVQRPEHGPDELDSRVQPWMAVPSDINYPQTEWSCVRLWNKLCPIMTVVVCVFFILILWLFSQNEYPCKSNPEISIIRTSLSETTPIVRKKQHKNTKKDKKIEYFTQIRPKQWEQTKWKVNLWVMMLKEKIFFQLH